MKLINLILLVILFNLRLFGSSSLFYHSTGHSNLLQQNEKPILSNQPTAQEFADVFYFTENGVYDPYDVLREIEARGDNCTKGLEKLIFSDKIKPNPTDLIGITGEKLDNSILTLIVNKEYALLALQRIASIKAFDVVINVVEKHNDVQLVSIALNILNANYKEMIIKEEIEPDKKIVKFFIDCLEDTTLVKYHNVKLDKICRNGLKVWLGKDYGDYADEDDINVETTVPHEKLTKEKKDKWWKDYSPKVKWNKNKNKFEINSNQN